MFLCSDVAIQQAFMFLKKIKTLDIIVSGGNLLTFSAYLSIKMELLDKFCVFVCALKYFIYMDHRFKG